MELESLAVEAASAALEAAAAFSADTDTIVTQRQIAEVCVEAAQPFWNIQAESLAITTRRLLDKILHQGPTWDPIESKKEVRDVAIALQAWESSRATV